VTPSDKKPGRDRDVLIKKNTPAAGVPAMRAPTSEEWAGDTGTNHKVDDDTPIGLENLDAEANLRLRGRVKETNLAMKQVSAATQAVHTGVDTLRLETKKDILRLETKIDNVDAKVDGLNGKFIEVIDSHGEMRGEFGEVKGTLNVLAKMIDQSREKQTISFEAHVDVEKASKITNIKDAADAKIKSRAFRYKLLRWIGAIIAAGATVLVTHYLEHC